MLQKIRWILWTLCVVALGILVFTLLQSRSGSQNIETPESTIAGIFIDPAQPLPKAQLATKGSEWTVDEFKGKWSVVFFGFTYCPDVCPAAMGLMKVAFNQLEPKVNAETFENLTGYLISVDPYRDTPEIVTDYAQFYSSKFEGVTGDPSEIAKLTKKFGVYVDFPEGTDTTTNYNVSHSSQFVVINPDGEFQAALTEHENPTVVANDLATIIDYWNLSQ